MAVLNGPVQPATRTSSLVEHLRKAVLAGAFEAGERLHEQRLTERFGVSRTPVRAALQALSSEGLLDHAPNRGYSVRSFPLSEVVSAYEVRAVLEGLAARLVAEKGLDGAARTLLERTLGEGDRLLAVTVLGPQHRKDYGAINSTFHETIHAAAGSRLLSDMVALSQRVPIASPRYVVAFEGRDVRRRHDDHHRIFEALTTRDPWRAEVLMREHVGGVQRAFVRSAVAEEP